ARLDRGPHRQAGRGAPLVAASRPGRPAAQLSRRAFLHGRCGLPWRRPARRGAALRACRRRGGDPALEQAKRALHPGTRRGGDGLLLWGDLLVRLERRGEAPEAYALAIARDGQSESARLAAERLREAARRTRCASSDTSGP